MGNSTHWQTTAAGILVGLLLAVLFRPQRQLQGLPLRLPSSVEHQAEDRRGREDFEILRLRDPATGTIPSDIRRRELALCTSAPLT